MAILRSDGGSPHLPERASEDEDELTAWAMDKILFFCCLMTFSHSVLGIHNPPSSINQVACHPPHAAKQGRKPLSTSSPVPGMQLVSRRGNLAASPFCKQMVQKEEKGKKKVPTGKIFCLHRVGDSRERLDYNPSYVFISTLLARCCSPWVSCLLITKARFIISAPGDRKSPATLQSKTMKTT